MMQTYHGPRNTSMLNHSADLNTMPTFETINATCNILDKHSFVSHFYTDNVQLYLTFHRTDITTLPHAPLKTSMTGWPQIIS